MRIAKKILIKPNANQRNQIDFWIRRCGLLYNVALQHKEYYYHATGKYLSVYDQKKELPPLKKEDLSWKDIPNKSLTEVLFRLDKSYKQFFKTKKGFPKFNHINTIFLTKNDVRLIKNELFLPKMNTSVKYNEEIDSNWKSVELSKQNNKYYMIFNYEVLTPEVKQSNETIGIDLGLINLFTDSNEYSQKRFSLKLYKNYQKRIKQLNQSLSRKKKNSIRFKKIKKQLNKTHTRLANSRNDYLHKVTTKYIQNNTNKTIIIGDIQVNQIIEKSNKGKRKSFYNSALNKVKEYFNYKSKLNGMELHFVNESYTSKTCSCCGYVNFDLKLWNRIYSCSNCKIDIDRDYNSAINIKNVWSGQFKPNFDLNSCNQQVAYSNTFKHI